MGAGAKIDGACGLMAGVFAGGAALLAGGAALAGAVLAGPFDGFSAGLGAGWPDCDGFEAGAGAGAAVAGVACGAAGSVDCGARAGAGADSGGA